MAAKDGITRTTNLFEDNSPGDKGSVSDDDHPPRLIEDDESDDEDETDRGPTMKPIPPDPREMGVNDVDIEDVDNEDDLPEPEVPIESDLKANEAQANQTNCTAAAGRLGQKIGETRAADRTGRRNGDSQTKIDSVQTPDHGRATVEETDRAGLRLDKTSHP